MGVGPSSIPDVHGTYLRCGLLFVDTVREDLVGTLTHLPEDGESWLDRGSCIGVVRRERPGGRVPDGNRFQLFQIRFSLFSDHRRPRPSFFPLTSFLGPFILPGLIP